MTEGLDRITRNPLRMGGKPCVRDRRVTVGAIVGLIAAGRTTAEVEGLSLRKPRTLLRPSPTQPVAWRKPNCRSPAGSTRRRVEADRGPIRLRLDMNLPPAWAESRGGASRWIRIACASGPYPSFPASGRPNRIRLEEGFRLGQRIASRAGAASGMVISG